jgi:hypothetical protein
MPTTDALLAGLLDEAAIRGIITRFADASIFADYEGFRALWADDAEWVIGATEGQPFERRAKGVDDIVSLYRTLREGRDYFVHFVVPGEIEIDGDEATVRSVCHEAARGPARTTTGPMVSGPITCSARAMTGCLLAAAIDTCGLTCRPSRETPSRPSATHQGLIGSEPVHIHEPESPGRRTSLMTGRNWR